MSENPTSVPPGALPPKPAEAAKIQPKKETVRINLPPKPTSSPTIKLPTLPAGGPPPPSIGVPAAAPTTAPRAVAPPAPPAARPAAAAPAATTAQRPAAPSGAAPAPRPAPAPVVVGVSGLDKGLAIAAMVISLASLGSVIYLAFILKDAAAN